jgi:hypothetical protein
LIGDIAFFVLANFNITQTSQTERGLSGKSSSVNENLVSQIVNQVLPPEGFKKRLTFSDTVKRMIDCGVIDLEKMRHSRPWPFIFSSRYLYK